jgi:ankyrin repeat protein
VLQPAGKDLWEAVGTGEFDKVRTQLDAGAPIEWASPSNGSRAIHRASFKGNNVVVTLLGSRGADINACDDKLYTPLHAAAYKGNASVCTALLALGANPSAKDKDGHTALDSARAGVWGGKPECVELLEAASRQ